jgi:hypothetical protein
MTRTSEAGRVGVEVAGLALGFGQSVRGPRRPRRVLPLGPMWCVRGCQLRSRRLLPILRCPQLERRKPPPLVAIMGAAALAPRAADGRRVHPQCGQQWRRRWRRRQWRQRWCRHLCVCVCVEGRKRSETRSVRVCVCARRRPQSKAMTVEIWRRRSFGVQTAADAGLWPRRPCGRTECKRSGARGGATFLSSPFIS